MFLFRLSFSFFLIIPSAFAITQITPCPNRNHPGVPNNPSCQTGFPAAITEIGNDSIADSSPTAADLDNDGHLEIIAGTVGGYIVTVHSDGTFFWAYKTGSTPILSKPAVSDIDGDGVPEVIVTEATGQDTSRGGVTVVSNTGQLKCHYNAHAGVYSSPALGRLDLTRPSELQIVVGTWGSRILALRPDCSVYWEKGLNDYVIDSVWSSAALYDLDADGQLDVVIGQDSNQQTINGYTLPNGGLLRAFRGNGAGELSGFPIQLDEVIYSSPAIGDITGIRQMAVAVGNGRCWDLSSCIPQPHAVTKAIYAWNKNGTLLSPQWPYLTPGESSRQSSPALADLDGDGKLEVILNTLLNDETNGNLHVLKFDGTELTGWPKQPDIPASCTPGEYLHYGTTTSPVVADVDGDGSLDIILTAANEFVIWDRFGNQLTTKNGCPAETGKYSLFSGGNSFFSSPTAADLDGDGHIEIIGTGSSAVNGMSGSFATIFAWSFPNSIATPDRKPWPQFRHDIRNTGVYLPDRIFKSGFEAMP